MLDIGLFPSLCIVATISSLVWLLMSRFVGREEPDWHDRLKTMVTDGVSPEGASSLLAPEEPQGRVMPALSSVLRPKDKIENQALAHLLGQAGFGGSSAVHYFLAAKLITMCFLGLTGAAVAGLYLRGDATTVSLSGMCGLALGMFLPLMMLRMIAKGRKEQIQLAIPGAVDLLVIALEAGIAIDQAMNEVAEEMRPISPALCTELEAYGNEMRLGGGRATALHNLGTRAGVDDLNAVANVLMQADRFGTAIAQALKEMARISRQKRRQRAEERASKTAVTLLVPLILFIFPGIFVILVGPAGITIFRDMVAL